MKVQIQRDQAVWERETFEVEVPDGLTGDDLLDAVSDAVESFQGYTDDGYDKCILDEAVYGISTETVATINGDEYNIT